MTCKCKPDTTGYFLCILGVLCNDSLKYCTLEIACIVYCTVKPNLFKCLKRTKEYFKPIKFPKLYRSYDEMYKKIYVFD